MNRFKTLIFSLILISAVAGVSAQPVPPHDIYGTVTDNGEAAEGILIEAEVDGTIEDSDTTGSNGDYSLRISSTASNFNIIVDGSTEESNIQFDSGASDQYDFGGDYIENTSEDETTNPSEDEGDTGPGGAPIDNNRTDEDQQDEQDQETPDESENQTQEGPDRVVEAVASENGTASADVGNVSANEKVQVTIPEQASADGEADVESVSFTSTSDASDVSVQVEDVGSDFEKVKDKVENKRPEGKVYSYQNIDVSNVEDDSVSEASVGFKISKAFIEENEATVEDVRLNRFHNGEWESYEAENTGETESHYRFEADTPGFSTYAITLAQEEEQVDQGGLPIVPILVILVIAVVAGAAYMYRDEVEEFMAGSESGESEDEDYEYEE